MKCPSLRSAYYEDRSRPLRERQVGKIVPPITRDFDNSRENQAGNLIADAQLADTDEPGRGDAVGALMNLGGVRADFTGDEIVTYEEAFTVQPFNNLVAPRRTRALSCWDQWCGTNSAPTVLLPSSTIHYTFDQAAATSILGKPCAGAANPVSGLTIKGTAVDPGATTGSRRTTSSPTAGTTSLR